MSAHVSLFTYVWHYVVARLLYDDLVRPLSRGAGMAALAVMACVATAVLIYRRRARRRRGARS